MTFVFLHLLAVTTSSVLEVSGRKQIWEETIKGGEEMLVVDPEAKYQEVHGP